MDGTIHVVGDHEVLLDLQLFLSTDGERTLIIRQFFRLILPLEAKNLSFCYQGGQVKEE